MLKISAFISALFLSITAYSQVPEFCGTTEKEREIRAANPGILIEEQKLNQFVNDWIKSNEAELRDEDVYVIPIVFHVIHDYASENITDEQVRDAVRILNEDFQLMNADTTDIVPAFKDIAADTKIEFRLANKNPGGECSNGIEHIHSLQTNIGDDESKLSGWPRNMYLNVWTVKKMEDGVAGYAYLPSSVNASSDAQVDGVIILSNYVGSIGTGSYSTSRALTHEIGHSLNMKHTWGNSNSPGEDCGDDGIQDTPETEGWTSCNLNGSVCNTGVIENVQNYMEYAYCSRMFTEDQKDVMRGVLNSNTADRNDLWKTSNLNETGTNDLTEPVCEPRVDFYSYQKTACIGVPVLFHDVSWNSSVDSRQWNFGDGNPALSTDKDPEVIWNTPGWKTVTLVCTNSAGTVSETRQQVIYIADNTLADHLLGYNETFEDANSFDKWVVLNNEGNNSAWKRATNAGYYSGASAYLNNHNNMNGDIDNLITPSYDLSGLTEVYFNFRYSCASNTSNPDNVNDVLNIYTSSNCGQTWTLRAVIKSTELANAGYFHYNFIPTNASQWKSKSIMIPGSFLGPNIRFKFEYKTNGKGNSIYLDDINVWTWPTAVSDPLASSYELNVYPNPLTESSIATLNLLSSGNVMIRIVDITGKVISVLSEGWLTSGEHHFDLKASQLENAGMYFLIADDGKTISRQKIVVQ